MSLLVDPRVGNLDLLWLQCGILLLGQEGRLTATDWLIVRNDTLGLLAHHLVRHVS